MNPSPLDPVTWPYVVECVGFGVLVALVWYFGTRMIRVSKAIERAIDQNTARLVHDRKLYDSNFADELLKLMADVKKELPAQ